MQENEATGDVAIDHLGRTVRYSIGQHVRKSQLGSTVVLALHLRVPSCYQSSAEVWPPAHTVYGSLIGGPDVSCRNYESRAVAGTMSMFGSRLSRISLCAHFP